MQNILRNIDPTRHDLIVITGPTASGKTTLAVSCAYELGSEIISADSRQVYKHMNLGTGKDPETYFIQNTHIKVHLIDICEPGEKYHVDAFKKDFFKVYSEMRNQKKIPILCGGTGLYILAVLRPHLYTSVPVNLELRNVLEPLSIETLQGKLRKYTTEFSMQADCSTKKRVIRAIEISEYLTKNPLPISEFPYPENPLIFCLAPDREQRRQRISQRLKLRFQQGLIDEVISLRKRGVGDDMLRYYGLEYKYVTDYLLGKFTCDEMYVRLESAIHQYAKRQMTWFRKMEKSGLPIHWLPVSGS